MSNIKMDDKFIEKFTKEIAPLFYYESKDLTINISETRVVIEYKGETITSFLGVEAKKRFFDNIK